MEENKAKLNFLKRWREDVQNVIHQKNEELEKVDVELIEANTKLEVYKEIPAEHEGVTHRLEEEIISIREKRAAIEAQIDEQKDIIKSIDNKIKQLEISYRY